MPHHRWLCPPLWGGLGIWLLLWFPSAVAAAATGSAVVPATTPKPPIKFGMSAPLTGRAKQLGLDYRSGAMLVFDAINHQGGIAGRPIQLMTLDDGYEPIRTVQNTRQFLFEEQILALFGYIGTPTSTAVLPLLRREKVPFLAPFTGADILREAKDHFIFHFRASYEDEVKAQMRYLVDQQQFRKIALLIQADEFGASVEKNFLAELSARQIKPVVISRFQRNTADLFQAVQLLKQHQPDLVLTVGTYQVLAEAILLAERYQFSPTYSVVSFTGVSQLAARLGPQHRVIASMVVPNPQLDQSALVQAYRQHLGPDGNLSDIALEGFSAATLVVQALQQCQSDISRACLLKALPQQALYDFPLLYDIKRHQMSQQVYLIQLKNQQLLPIQ